MSKPVTIRLEVKMPFEYVQEFLQHIRDFEHQNEAHHRDCAFIIPLDAPEVSVGGMKEVLEAIRPNFPGGVIGIMLDRTKKNVD